MPAPICSNIHRINEVTNNRQQLLVEGFSFYAVAEISTTGRKTLMAFHAARQKAEESEEKELSLEDINREMNEARKGKK